MAHAPYTMNACAADPGLREFAQNMMRDDLARLEHTPGNYYNFHPGSHVQQGVQTGVALITAQLNSVLLPEQRTMVLLETMAVSYTHLDVYKRQVYFLQSLLHRREELDEGILQDHRGGAAVRPLHGHAALL